MENKYFENKILEKTKLKIAISEFGKDYTMREKNIGFKKFGSYKKLAVASLIICLLIIGTVKAKKMLKYSENIHISIPVSISNAVNNGYVENLNMDYAYSDGVGLKINSLLLSETDINFVFDFKLDNDIELENEMFAYDYIVYNENNELYITSTGFVNRNFIKDFAKEHNINVSKLKIHQGSGNIGFLKFTKNNIITNERYEAKDIFPKAKKIYIQVMGIGYMDEGTYKPLTNSEWLFELDIPDKFYLADNIEYKLKENVEGIEVEKILLTDTSMMLIANVDGVAGKTIDMSIIDENGKEYNSYGGSRSNYEKKYIYSIQEMFPINKNMITNKVYLKINVNNEEKIVKLVKK